MKSSHITRSIQRSSNLLLAIVVIASGLPVMGKAKTTPTCRRWLDKVAQSPKHAESGQSELRGGSIGTIDFVSTDPWGIASLTEAEKLDAIQCLLGAENDLRPAAFGGVTRLDVSQLFAPVHVDLAALYAISYIFTGHFDHGDAVALRGKHASASDHLGNYVTRRDAIHRAYRAYREWFAKVRQVGLANAHESGLQPLEGSGLRWY